MGVSILLFQTLYVLAGMGVKCLANFSLVNNLQEFGGTPLNSAVWQKKCKSEWKILKKNIFVLDNNQNIFEIAME